MKGVNNMIKKKRKKAAIFTTICTCGILLMFVTAFATSGTVKTSYDNTKIVGTGRKDGNLVTFGAFITSPDDVAYHGKVWAYANGVTSKVYDVKKGVPVYSKQFRTSSSSARVFVNVNNQNSRSCILEND